MHNIWWSMFYLLGLHFTHLDFLPGMNAFVFDPAIMNTWSVELWIILAVGLVFGIALFTLLVLFTILSGFYVCIIYLV